MKSKFFLCECGTEGILVTPDEYGTEIAIMYRSPNNMPFWSRLHSAWMCLRGRPYADQVILSKENVKDLANYLTGIGCAFTYQLICEHEKA